jgi:hypothetical protein
MRGVIGAIDGSHIPIKAPPYKDYPEDYFNRKHFFSIILQAVVDGTGKFPDLFVGWPGSAHDARVFENSKIAQKLAAGTLMSPGKVILGDSGYPLRSYLMTPFRDDGHLSDDQRDFNYVHSSTRMVVERAFGELKSRWAAVRTGLNVSFDNTIIVTTACCVLHNFCKSQDDSLLPEEMQRVEQILAEEQAGPDRTDSNPVQPEAADLRPSERVRHLFMDDTLREWRHVHAVRRRPRGE